MCSYFAYVLCKTGCMNSLKLTTVLVEHLKLIIKLEGGTAVALVKYKIKYDFEINKPITESCFTTWEAFHQQSWHMYTGN